MYKLMYRSFFVKKEMQEFCFFTPDEALQRNGKYFPVRKCCPENDSCLAFQTNIDILTVFS